MEEHRQPPEPNPSPRPGLRWWPAAMLVVLALAWLGRIWLGEASQTQDRVVPTIIAAGLTVLLLLLWLVAFSRLPGRLRLRIAGGAAVLFAIFVALFEIQGVSGDFVPIVSWRFRADSSFEAATHRAAAVAAPAPTDYAQFLGPTRTATVHGTRLARDWAARPPKEVWRRGIGEGWSAFAVAGDALVTQEQRDGREAVARYSLATGELVWAHPYDAHYESVISGNGPRATPTVAGDRVYALGTTGRLHCLDLGSGRVVWQRDIVAEDGAKANDWGFAGSPLALGDLLVVAAGNPAGKSLIAYRRDTGEVAWAAGDDPISYSSPTLATVAGGRQILILNQQSLAAHDPADGRVLWHQQWPGREPKVSQPLVIGEDRVLLSAGYGLGALLLRVERDAAGTFAAHEIWRNIRLKAKFSSSVLHEGFVYGLDDGILVCLDPATGERCWKRGRYGHGQLLLVEDLLLVTTEKGEVVLIEPHPDELRELGRFRALPGKSWNCPAISGPYLLLRNHREAACYELPLAGSEPFSAATAASKPS